jgi:2-epi-valiolone-7-phosphate 1-reductase
MRATWDYWAPAFLRNGVAPREQSRCAHFPRDNRERCPLIAPERPLISTHTIALARGPAGVFSYDRALAAPVRPDSLRVTLLTAGICGTDIDIVRGVRPDNARILGHEGIGVVSEVGARIADWHVGDRVSFSPVSVSNPREVLGHSFDGVFQTSIQVSPRDAPDLLVPLPSTIANWCAPVIEPVAVLSYAHEIVTRIVAINDVLIVGTGGMAHIAAAYWTSRGRSVAICSTSEHRYAALASSDPSGTRYLQPSDLGRRAPFSFVMVCASRSQADAASDIAVAAVAHGGVIDFVSGSDRCARGPTNAHEHTTSIDDVRRSNSCGEGFNSVIYESTGKWFHITGHRGCGPRHFSAAIHDLLSADDVYKDVIGLVIPFTALAEFLNRRCPRSLTHRGKILVEFSQGLAPPES